MLVQFFFFNLLNEVTHRQNKGSAEKIFSLKVTLDITKLVSSSGRPHSIFWLHSSYIATVFSPHFCFLKSPLSEPVTRLNWYFWLLRLKYPAPVIWAISLSNSLLGDSFQTQLENKLIYSIFQKKWEAGAVVSLRMRTEERTGLTCRRNWCPATKALVPAL